MFNERTGTSLNHLQVPTDTVLLVVLWRLRDQLSLRDLAEMFLERGFTFTHGTVRGWEAPFAPLAARLRATRRGAAGSKWHADETAVRVDGRWCYLYRAIDRDGNLVDAQLRPTDDMETAQRFFARALEVAGLAPVLDGHDAYPQAIRDMLGGWVFQRTSRHKNNRIEQDHRSIKQILYSSVTLRAWARQSIVVCGPGRSVVAWHRAPRPSAAACGQRRNAPP